MPRLGRFALIFFEIAFLSALILATRCANYQDVFVGGNIYFIDADCYARMTRVQMCAEKPGLIVRHHDFENFPYGTIPHTTAPFDYLILGLSLPLKPFTTQPLDLAGAWISPLLALVTGWFLWWWSRRMGFRHPWVLLILYAISPILVHGTELGRPDHQSLLLLLVAIAICAEWNSQIEAADTTASKEVKRWAVVSRIAWGLAMWVSAYEPLVLFLIVAVTAFLINRATLFGRHRRAGWILFAAIIVIALLIERRVPSIAIFQSNPSFENWARTIGELAHVSPLNPVWFGWCGFLLLVAPFLIWRCIRTRNGAPEPRFLPVYVLLIATYFLTIWQARWGYFFVLIFAISLPALLVPIKSRVAVWTAFFLSIFPILRDWDSRLWPDEEQLLSRMEKRIESAQIRELALSVRSSEVQPFLAPWWLSPSIVYWSGQPGVAGSSHESLNGIEDSARFFLSEDLQEAREILLKRRVAWVFAYDSERVAQNSAAIVNEHVPPHPLCRVLDRTPSQAPPFLMFSAQNAACKLYREKLFTQKRESVDRHRRVSHYYQMLKRFVPQKPAPPIREEPRNPEPNDNNHRASREEPASIQTVNDNPNPKPNPMADHGGKDILSSDVEIKGSIKFQKELLIDGKVEGDINSDGVLTVGENAEIRGEIKTKSITVYGKVHGNITVAERCELKSKCVLQGDLKAARLVIEEGATFIGKSEVTTGAVSKAAPRPEVVRPSEPIKAAFGVRA